MKKVPGNFRERVFRLTHPPLYSPQLTLFPQKNIGPEDLAVWTVEIRPPSVKVEEGLGALVGIVRLRPGDTSKTGRILFEGMAGLGFKEMSDLVPMALKGARRHLSLYFVSVNPKGNPLLLSLLEMEGFRKDPENGEGLIRPLSLHTLFSVILCMAIAMPLGELFTSLKLGALVGLGLGLIYSQGYRRIRRDRAWEKRLGGESSLT